MMILSRGWHDTDSAIHDLIDGYTMLRLINCSQQLDAHIDYFSEVTGQTATPLYLMQIRPTFDVYMLSKLQPLRDEVQQHSEGYRRDRRIHALEESCKGWQSLCAYIWSYLS